MTSNRLDESKLQYFDKVTGQSDHRSHITSPDQMNDNDRNSHDNDETLGLLIAEPTPVRYNSIPSLIRNDEDIVVDDQPTTFYSRWRLGLYIITGIIFATSLFIIMSLLNIRYVLQSIEVEVNNVEILETNNTGALVNLQSINVNFKNAGVLNWIENFNHTEIEFFDNTIIYNEKRQPILEIDTNNRSLIFTVSKNFSHHWVFNLDELFINIEGEQLRNTIHHLSAHKTSVFYVSSRIKFSGKLFTLNRIIKLKKTELDGILDRVFSELMAGVSVKSVQIDEYDSAIGFTGKGDAAMKFNSIKKMRLPKIDTSLGVTINDDFYEIVDFTFNNFANIGDEHFVLFNFTLLNVNETIINSGVVNDILWRLLNDDSKEERFEIIIKGNGVDDEGWLRDTWKDLILGVGFRFHDILKSSHNFWKPDITQTWKNVDVTDFQFGLDDTNGQFLVNAHLLYLYDILMRKFEANVKADISFSGINLSLPDTTIKKIDDLFIEATIRNSSVDIVNVRQSEKFLQDLLDNNHDDDYVPFRIESQLGIYSDFFNGPVEINGSILVSLNKFTPTMNQSFSKINDGFIELVDIKYIGGEGEHVKFGVDSKVRMPSFIGNFKNEIEVINNVIDHEFEELFRIAIFPFKGSDSLIPLQLEITLDSSDDNRKRRVEEFVGEILSGVTANISVSGISSGNNESIHGCNKNVCELYDHVSIPLSLSSKDITGDDNGGNFFIRDTVMHIISKEVEMTLFNPVSNRNLILEIEEGEAICEGYVIGYLKEKITWEVEPGIWKSPKAKVEYANTGSAGWKIIENAMKGDGKINNMTVRAVVKVYIGGNTQWSGLSIMYRSTGQTNGKVRW